MPSHANATKRASPLARTVNVPKSHSQALRAAALLLHSRHPGDTPLSEHDLGRLLRSTRANAHVMRRCYRALRIIATGKPEPLEPGLFSHWWERLNRLQQAAALQRAVTIPEQSLGLPPLDANGIDTTTAATDTTP